MILGKGFILAGNPVSLVANVIFVVDGGSIQGHNHLYVVCLVRNHVHGAEE